MKIVFVNPGENLDDARKIRTKIFVEEQGYTPEEEFDTLDPLVHHVIVYNDTQEPIATGRVLPYPEIPGAYQLGRIAVLYAYRGTGLGRVVVEALEQKATELGATYFWLNAQQRVEPFYTKLGYQNLGSPNMDGHVPHVNMGKSL